MKIKTASISMLGNRQINQDYLSSSVGQLAACFILCDGVASFPGGDIAAKLACHTLIEQFNSKMPFRPKEIPRYIQTIQQAIYNRQQQESELSRMSTTLISLFIDRCQQIAYWVHAGDSRLYLFRRGQLSMRTVDHTLVQKMQDAGYQTKGVNNNLLYFALGSHEDRDATYSDAYGLNDGDVFLLCSDGFWQQFTSNQLEHSLRLVNTPEEWLILLQDSMIAGQQHDNYSAIAVWIGSPQETTLLQVIPPFDEPVFNCDQGGQ